MRKSKQSIAKSNKTKPRQFNRQTSKISALSLKNVSKYEFLTDKDVLQEKDLLEKVAAVQIFEYSQLGKELENQASVAENHYQKLDNAFESNKKGGLKTKNKRSHAKTNLVYNKYFTFYKYRKNKEFVKRFFGSKINDLKTYKYNLKLFYHENMEFELNNKCKLKDLEERVVQLNTALELCNKLLNTYKTQYDKLTKANKERIKI